MRLRLRSHSHPLQLKHLKLKKRRRKLMRHLKKLHHQLQRCSHLLPRQLRRRMNQKRKSQNSLRSFEKSINHIQRSIHYLSAYSELHLKIFQKINELKNWISLTSMSRYLMMRCQNLFPSRPVPMKWTSSVSYVRLRAWKLMRQSRNNRLTSHRHSHWCH